MKVKRFLAESMKAAFAQIKSQLGDEAIILSNRATPSGVEILAISASEMASLMVSESDLAAAAPPQNVALSALLSESLNISKRKADPAPTESKPPPSMPRETLRATESARDPTHEFARELTSLRGFLDQRLAAFATTIEPNRRSLASVLTRELLSAGFSPAVARAVVNSVDPEASIALTRQSLLRRLGRSIQVASPSEGLIGRGGMFALTGPTGVGKTTTVAKIAARCVLKYGPDSVGLITTDSYRIGAEAQLRTYADILQVPVITASDSAALMKALVKYSTRRLVLIDSAGMSQRDERVAASLQMLDSCGVARILLLAATGQVSTLDEVAQMYGLQKGVGAAGVIITKLDEAVQTGGVVDVLLRHKLPVHYFGVGQRVPEDLQVPDVAALVEQAMKPRRNQDFEFTHDEAEFASMPFSLAPQSESATNV
jgi:flagellar biosynthesis protein FlhF